MAFMLGANAAGQFDYSTTTTTGQWQILSISKAGGTGSANTSNEVQLYSTCGPATFFVDSIWLNQGMTNALPGASVPAPAAPACWRSGCSA